MKRAIVLFVPFLLMGCPEAEEMKKIKDAPKMEAKEEAKADAKADEAKADPAEGKAADSKADAKKK